MFKKITLFLLLGLTTLEGARGAFLNLSRSKNQTDAEYETLLTSWQQRCFYNESSDWSTYPRVQLQGFNVNDAVQQRVLGALDPNRDATAFGFNNVIELTLYDSTPNVGRNLAGLERYISGEKLERLYIERSFQEPFFKEGFHRPWDRRPSELSTQSVAEIVSSIQSRFPNIKELTFKNGNLGSGALSVLKELPLEFLDVRGNPALIHELNQLQGNRTLQRLGTDAKAHDLLLERPCIEGGVTLAELGRKFPSLRTVYAGPSVDFSEESYFSRDISSGSWSVGPTGNQRVLR